MIDQYLDRGAIKVSKPSRQIRQATAQEQHNGHAQQAVTIDWQAELFPRRDGNPHARPQILPCAVRAATTAGAHAKPLANNVPQHTSQQ